MMAAWSKKSQTRLAADMHNIFHVNSKSIGDIALLLSQLRASRERGKVAFWYAL
jgi:hypothetical protein